MTAVAVTGLGVLAPNGVGTEEYWAATLSGRSAIGPLTRFDASTHVCPLAGEITGFDAEKHLPARLLPQTDRMTNLALVAAEEAMDESGIDVAALGDHSVGVVTASAAGGFEFGQYELQKLWSKGGSHVSAYQSFAWFYAVNTGQISIRAGLRGQGGVLISEQAGGLDAAATARRALTREHEPARAMITGGFDSAICPWGWAAYGTLATISRSDDPERAYLPFDERAGGHVPGEGGAALLLEPPESALERGCRPYGLISGHASVFDPDGSAGAVAHCARSALDDAGLVPGDVDLVLADAAGTPAQDRSEAEAITDVFGARAVPVTAPKTMLGRLRSGGSPVDLATALLSLRDQVVPPTVNVDPWPGYHLDLVVGRARAQRVGSVLVIARGHGGFVSTMVVEEARHG